MATRSGAGLGIAAELGDRKQDLDQHMIIVQDGVTTMLDMQRATSRNAPKLDEDEGGVNGISEFAGRHDGETQVVQFARPLDTGDSTDVAIVPGAEMIPAGASSDAMDLARRHDRSNRGSAFVLEAFICQTFAVVQAEGAGRRSRPRRPDAHAPPSPGEALMYPRDENARARKEAAMAFALSDLKLRSPAFDYHTRIPTRFTQDGENLSPPLVWENVPEGTESFAILCHDPDAPLVQHGMYGFVHWLLAGIPGDARSLEEATEIGIPGRNDGGSEGYRGPRPPEGHGTHHYYFWLFALATDPVLPGGLDLAAFLGAIEPHVLGMNRLVGTYRRGD